MEINYNYNEDIKQLNDQYKEQNKILNDNIANLTRENNIYKNQIGIVTKEILEKETRNEGK
jgi:hypothetical protein